MRPKGEQLEGIPGESSGLWTGIPKGSPEAREGMKEQKCGSLHCILELSAAGCGMRGGTGLDVCLEGKPDHEDCIY